MSSTRRADADSPYRQERYASSAEFERGLLGNLVAKRCELLDNPDDHALLWWLQHESWKAGGLKHFAAGLLAKYPDRIATASMLRFGFKPGQNYNAEQVKAVRREIEPLYERQCFPLSGETSRHDERARDAEYSRLVTSNSYNLENEIEELRDRQRRVSEKHPSQYPASDFKRICEDHAGRGLAQFLADLALDPAATPIYSPWYFAALIETLREEMEASAAAARAGIVITTLGQAVHDALDYALETRCMVLIDGLARTGKTFSAVAWCNARAGRVRYCQCPSTNDDIAFFRALASAVGVSINQNSKAQELRQRVEDVFRSGQLMLVLDEAHYAWPQGNFREKMPARINWLMTALVNHGIPVALITTPQFLKTQKTMEKHSAWTSEQFTGRIGHYEKLPDSLTKNDLQAVAKNLLPEGCARSIDTLVAYAQASAKYVAGIGLVIQRARYLAAKAKRQKVLFEDIRAAITTGVIPSDNALKHAIDQAAPQGRRRSIAAPARPVRSESATPPQTSRAGARRKTPDADLELINLPIADRPGIQGIAAG